MATASGQTVLFPDRFTPENDGHAQSGGSQGGLFQFVPPIALTGDRIEERLSFPLTKAGRFINLKVLDSAKE